MRRRGAEFETVLALLDGTQQGQGRVLLVEGEPGTGKSLLLARAGEEAGRRGFRVVAAAAGELSPAPSLDGRSGPSRGCWRPIRCPGSWPWARHRGSFRLEDVGEILGESPGALLAAAVFRGELARRVERPVRAEDYQVAVFEREGPPGEAVRLTRVEVKPAVVADVVDVYGHTTVPWLARKPDPAWW